MDSLYKEEEDGFKPKTKDIEDHFLDRDLEVRKSESKEV